MPLAFSSGQAVPWGGRQLKKQAARNNNLSKYGAGILTSGKALARRKSVPTRRDHKRATLPAGKRVSQNAMLFLRDDLRVYRTGFEQGVIDDPGHNGLPLDIWMDTVADEKIPPPRQCVENIDTFKVHGVYDSHNACNHAMGRYRRIWSFYRSIFQRRGQADKNTRVGGKFLKMSHQI